MGGGCGMLEGVGHLPQSKIMDLTDKRENAAVRPLSVEAEEFSLGTGPGIECRMVMGTSFRPAPEVELYNVMRRYRPQPRLGTFLGR